MFMTPPPQTLESECTTNISANVEREADLVVRELRSALAAVVEGVRPPVARAADLKRALNLGQTLAWALFNAATSADARGLPSLMPRRRGMERFLEAAQRNGVPPEAIARARATFERFEASVARHAGSRETFGAMVAGLGEGSGEEGISSELKHKRAAFRANSVLWGRQTRAFCAASIVHPSQTPGRMDTINIAGMAGLHRTQRAAPLHTVVRAWRWATPPDPEPTGPVALDPREGGPGSLHLLRDFCSQPLPEFRLLEEREGYRSYELVSEGLGASAELTYFFGDVYLGDGVPPGTAPGAEVTLFKTVDIPMQTYLGHMIVHRSLWGTRPPIVRIYAAPPDGSREFRDRDVLPLTERAEYLGDGIDAARTPLLPRLGEMLEYAMERMGWKGEEFRVFRCRVDYPVMHTRIWMTLGRE